ncbi:MAG: hypothetical protein JWM31_2023 [Solirubrobacterales bacterium]|nr:hypothetical protein [Solirubrobacterales bacterium]
MSAGLSAWAVLLAVAAPSGAATDPVQKLDSALRGLRTTSAVGGDVAARARAGQLEVTPGQRVSVDVTLAGPPDAAIAQLQAAGMEVRETGARPTAIAEGRVPVDALEDLAALGVVRTVAPVVAFGTDTVHGGQGDTAHRGPAARALPGAGGGAGVKVGIISDSMNQVDGGIATSQANGDLPPNPRVTVLTDDTGPGVIDEGRAMAEILYDSTPNIDQLVFASGTATGAVGKANAISALVGAGVKVIADDIYYLSEPFFQDGQIAQAVDAAKAAGVTYFASAGNRARQSWEGTYADSGGFESFNGADGDTTQTVTSVPNGTFIQFALQWNEPWGAAATNLDVQLVNAATGTPLTGVSGGTTNNLVTNGNPAEAATWTNSTGATVTVGIRIKRTAGTGTPFMKYIVRRGSGGAFAVAEYPTDSDTINPDAASARGAIAVAAVDASAIGHDTPESFSSRGPKTRLRGTDGALLTAPRVLLKPQLAAADGVATGVPSPLATFYGTSAAAPSAAGVAALALSADPALSPDAVEALMSDPARNRDCMLSPLSPDPDCGAGFVFVFADTTVQQALDVTPPTVTPAITGIKQAAGFYTSDVAVSWTVADAQSAVYEPPGCAATTVSSDTAGATVTCAAQSGGGVATASVTVKRDTTPPTPPAFTGIAAREYAAGDLPPSAAVGCTSSDATSGLASCTVAGYDTGPGTHTLTATATDGVGLTSASTLVYAVKVPAVPLVVPPPVDVQTTAVMAPIVSAFTGPAAARSGRPATFRVTVDRPATVIFTVTKAVASRRVRDRCVAVNAANRRRARCLRTVKLGTFRTLVGAGTATVVFSGRLAGHPLSRGTYRITAVAQADGLTSAPRARSLVIRR